MPGVEVIVPLAGDCPYRQAAWEFCRDQYPWAVTEARNAADEPWSKGRAVWPALTWSTADIVAIADADAIADRLSEAVAAVEAGAPWAMPHRSVHRLTEASTAGYINGADPGTLPLEQRVYGGMIGGGIIVARREVLLDCPLDPRFVGGGQEDTSWGIALQVLHGPVWRPRGYAPLWHLWHPPQERLSRATGSIEGRRLARRYQHARRKPEAMRQIVKEAHVAHANDLHALHAPPRAA